MKTTTRVARSHSPKPVRSVVLGVALFLVSLAALLFSRQEAHAQPQRTADSVEVLLSGQLLLPEGTGSRGVEVVVSYGEGATPKRRWVLFDEQGNFEDSFPAPIRKVSIRTGIVSELIVLGSNDIPCADAAGAIDLGKLDLRDHLVPHQLLLHPRAELPSREVIRIAMTFGLPPRGPQGMRIALGSRQFPPIEVGEAVEWLLPNEAEDVYFLVEWPRGSDWQTRWDSGRQQLFGPFDSSTLPRELILD